MTQTQSKREAEALRKQLDEARETEAQNQVQISSLDKRIKEKEKKQQ